jgi:hypothetical protein
MSNEINDFEYEKAVRKFHVPFHSPSRIEDSYNRHLIS